MTIVISLPKRLWPNVEIWSDPDMCWPWLGTVDPKGYGKLKIKGKWVSSHRLAYQLAKGPIPVGMSVCHACDNPPCCNPFHLWIGTHAENMRDMQTKGRGCFGQRRTEKAA